MKNPVDYFNESGSWKECFAGIKTAHFLSETQIADGETLNKPSFIISKDRLSVVDDNLSGLPVNSEWTKFDLLSALQHKGSYRSAITAIEIGLMGQNIPFIRVGPDYYRVVEKRDRYGVSRSQLKAWRKEEIKQDYGSAALKRIPSFDDFCLVPENIDYKRVIDNCYNLYEPICHVKSDTHVSSSDLPVTIAFLRHIFGEQFRQGLTYMKVLFEHPKQILPILCLVSEKRATGKTTFINWLDMIFGDNFTTTTSANLLSEFNSLYAEKNIIAVEEAMINKSEAIERLKALSTGKTISVNRKFVSAYKIPFFGKIIMLSNKVRDFMRIDEEEVRFWVREIPDVNRINTNIEADMKAEIPAFLQYLFQLPAVDLRKSRQVFANEDIINDSLLRVKEESISWLHKELLIYIDDFFSSNSCSEFEATAKDIKEAWFTRNTQVTAAYIHKVIRDEMKVAVPAMKRYDPFLNTMNKRPGKPFLFKKISLFNESMSEEKLAIVNEDEFVF